MSSKHRCREARSSPSLALWSRPARITRSRGPGPSIPAPYSPPIRSRPFSGWKSLSGRHRQELLHVEVDGQEGPDGDRVAPAACDVVGAHEGCFAQRSHQTPEWCRRRCVLPNLGSYVPLAVKKGGTIFIVKIYGVAAVDKQEEYEKALALDVVKHL